jgi:GxxExxY protein
MSEKIIVDPKVAATFDEAHIAQMVGYLAISGLELALLLNFKSARLDRKRVVRQRGLEPAIPYLNV